MKAGRRLLAALLCLAAVTTACGSGGPEQPTTLLRVLMTDDWVTVPFVDAGAVGKERPMGRAKRMGGGTPGTGLAIEYVRKRKVVRLLGWLAETPIEPVEIPVDQLLRGLAVSPRDVGAAQLFLLFAGSQRRPEGGLRDLVGTFEVEDDAWAAFRGLRQSHPAGQDWAELAAIDASGHVNQLAWFGVHPDASWDGGSVRARAGRNRVTAGGTQSYLRAVTPS